MKKLTLLIILTLITTTTALNVKITQPQNGETIDKISIYLNGTIEGGTPPYAVYWISDLDGQVDSTGLGSPGYVLTAPSFGTHKLTLKVIDSTGREASDTVTVTVEEPTLDVRITSPPEGVKWGSETLFNAELNGTPPYRIKWMSDRDGLLGTDVNLTRSLSLGEHVITLRVSDLAGIIANQTVEILVKPAPKIELLSPIEKEYMGEVLFEANISGGSPPYELEWKSDIDGLLGSEQDFVKELSPGEHTITLNVSDSLGAPSTAYVGVSILEPLRASIKKPENGSYPSLIEFEAYISGGKSPYDIKWSSSRDGFLSNEEAFSTKLSKGSHIIEVEIIDSNYFITKDRVNVTVDGSSYLTYGLIFFLLACLGYFYLKTRKKQR